MENNPTWMLVVAAALSDGRGRWLMHRRALSKPNGGLWEFPGGKVDGLEMPTESLVRELHEELGIGVNPAELVPAGFAEAQPDPGRLPIVILLYSLARWQGEPRALEGEGIGWFTPQEIFALPKPPLDEELARNLFGPEAG